MMKKITVLLACLSLAFQLTSCTSKDSQSEPEMSVDVDSADLEKVDDGEALDVAEDSHTSDQLPEDALGETTTTTETTTVTSDDHFADDQASTEHTDVATSTETTPSDSLVETTPDVSSTFSTDTSSLDTSSSMTESSHDTTTVVDSEPPAPKPSVPLQKVATTPWKVGSVWANTVYFARPGDTLKGISQMIYGSDKTKELKKINPTFASRGVKPGDKVYYNSPHRADDSARLITYYEDNGIAPEVYVAKSGDNIRRVSKDLLGYDGAWKEVWASNSVESKASIPEGTELRYWRKDAAMAAAPAPVSNQTEAVPHQEMAGSAPGNEMAPPPPMEDMSQQAHNDLPPPPAPDMGHMESESFPPPPAPDMAAQDLPPPPEAMTPPAPPVAAAPTEHIEEEGTGEMNNDMMMAMGVGGIAAAALVFIIIRKKRKQKELEQQVMDNTHVGT